MVRFQTRSVLLMESPDGYIGIFDRLDASLEYVKTRDCLNAAVVHKPYGQSIGFSAMAESRSINSTS